MARAAGKGALAVVIALLFMSVLAASGMMYLLRTDSGNRRLCDFVASKIGLAFRGKFEIARVVDLKLDSIHAQGVRFIAPDGVAAIDVPDVIIDFEPLALLRGQYGWSRAMIHKPLVRVTQRKEDKTNMEQVFAAPKRDDDEKKKDQGASVDMRTMITKDATLLIYGGDLPELKLTHLDGVMRIEIAPNGDTVLRFDEYKGKLDGLPIGDLDFREVKGQVWTAGKKLLHFEGAGRNRDEPVDFELDITSEPTKVHIGAIYEDVSMASVHTRLVGAWTALTSNVDIDVSHQKN